MKCLTLSRLIAYQNDLLNKSETNKIKHHLQSCKECEQRMKGYGGLNTALQRSSPLDKKIETSRCLDETQLLSFLEGRSNNRKRQEFYHHLAYCPACTEQLIGLEEFLHDLKKEGVLPAEKRIDTNISQYFKEFNNTISDGIISLGSLFKLPRPVYQFVGFVVVLLIVVMVLDHQQFVSNLSFNTREPAVNLTESSIRLLAPTNHSTVKPNTLQFRWTKVSHAASYTFLLLNAQGDIILEQNTDDVKLTFPAHIQLQTPGTYFWQVECLLEQGGSMVSEMASFSFKNK